MSEKILDTPDNVKILNEKLGITSRENLFNSAGIKSISEMLESSKKDFEVLCKQITEKKEEADKAENEVSSNMDTIKNIAKRPATNESLEMLNESSAVVTQFNDIIGSMQSLIEKGNGIIEKIYDAVVNTDIIDPDLLTAASNMIHCIRESNSNLIEFATAKLNIEAQFRLAIETEKQKQKNRLELEFFKWQLRQKELENKSRIKQEEEKAKQTPVDDTQKSGFMWSANNMAEILRNSDRTSD